MPPKKTKRTLPKAAEPYKFKPGQSGNPSGRPKLTPIPNALKQMTKQSLRRVIRAVCKGNLDNLKAMAEDPKRSALEVAVASCFVKAISRGDYATVEHIVQRVTGKIPDEININSLNRNINFKQGPLDPKLVKAALAQLESEI